jgi:predicted metal-dependent HD superfamily phosphohydrolase
MVKDGGKPEIMNNQELLANVRRYITDFFSSGNFPTLSFYTIAHTKSLVKSAKGIAGHTSLNKKDLHLLEIAAWFHDTGYVTESERQLTASARHAREFLEKEKMDDHSIKKITSAITATAFPLHPSGLLEEILCDAVFFYLGKKSFAQSNRLLRKDTAFFRGKEITEAEWQIESRELFNRHEYCISHTRPRLDAGKKKNLQRINKLYSNSPPENHLMHPDHVQNKILHESEKRKSQYDKGVETMFRVVASSNQRLNAMADRKAHILITVNSIILSVIISMTLRKLDENILLIYPIFLLLLVGLTTIIISILATRPVVPGGPVNQHSLKSKIDNLLYFGNFYQMKLEDYLEQMLLMMSDSDEVYRSLITSIYQQGSVLARKYEMLRTAYTVFMFGLIISILAFITAYGIHHSTLDLGSMKALKIKK